MTSSGTLPADPRADEVRRLAHLLDRAFRVPGTDLRFGVDGLIGLIPGIGDVAGLVLAGVVIAKGIQLGARGSTVARMVVNAAVDAAVGTIPVAGTIADFFIKANTRNVRLLEQHALDPQRTREDSRAVLIRTVIAIALVAILLVVGVIALVVWLISLL